MAKKNARPHAQVGDSPDAGLVVDHVTQVLQVITGVFGVFVQLFTTKHMEDAERLLQTTLMATYADLTGGEVGGVDGPVAWKALAAELDSAANVLTNKADNQPARMLANNIRAWIAPSEG